MTIKIGVIGTADIAKRRMIPAIKQSEHFEYVGVAIANSSEWEEPHSDDNYDSVFDAKKIKAQGFQELFGGKVYLGYEELLKSSDVDAVYIPLPPSLHYKWGMLALENGKHVLMEKPFSISFEQTNELLRIAMKKKLAIIENYGFIYHSQFKKIKELYEDGEIGELREIRATFGFPHRENTDFRYKKKYGGGALFDCGGYTVKAACEFLSNPEVVFSSLSIPDGYEVDLYGSTILKDSNITAYLSYGMDNSYKCDFELWGSKGNIVSNRAYTAPESFESVLYMQKMGENFEIPCGKSNQFLLVLEKFYKSINELSDRSSLYNSIEKQQRIIQSIFDKS